MRFNSGKTLHLAPNGISEEILEMEIKSNAQIKKLEERRIISCSSTTAVESKKEKIDSVKGRK
jgi:hypothetical protein